MLHAISIWLLCGAFLAAGLVNVLGLPAIQESFVRWGFPRWWCYVTGGLEIGIAILIAVPGTRPAGAVLGAIVIGAAIVTICWRREFSHLPPLSLFVVLLALAHVAC